MLLAANSMPAEQCAIPCYGDRHQRLRLRATQPRYHGGATRWPRPALPAMTASRIRWKKLRVTGVFRRKYKFVISHMLAVLGTEGWGQNSLVKWHTFEENVHIKDLFFYYITLYRRLFVYFHFICFQP